MIAGSAPELLMVKLADETINIRIGSGEQLQAFFRDEAGTQYGRILAVPQSPGIPEPWILSSSGGSSVIAARYGLGLAVAMNY